MSHVHPIQEKKITIKAFKKLKSTVYKLDRDNVGQYLIFDNIEPNKKINLDEFLIIFLESIFRAFLLYLLPILFTNLGLLYTKWVSLMVTLSDTNSFNIINA
jgi:hypothetical protein